MRPSDSLRLASLPEAYRAQLERTLSERETHRAQGRAAKAAGDSLEAWLEAQHKLCIVSGLLARMAHVGPPTVHVRRGGSVVLVETAPGPADYQGQASDGRAVAVEAKSRTGRLRRDEITVVQAADLTACARHGGVALLVYEHRDGPRVRRFAVPWLEVPWTRLRSVETVGPEDLSRREIRRSPYLEGLL